MRMERSNEESPSRARLAGLSVLAIGLLFGSTLAGVALTGIAHDLARVADPWNFQS